MTANNNRLGLLTTVTGKWAGTSQLWLSPTEDAKKSSATLDLAPTLKGKFFEVKYTWMYEDSPQNGLLIIGYQPDRELATAVWLDTWHMGDQFMTCQGTLTENRVLNVRGTYTVPTGPDWGWRIILEPVSEQALNLIMYNLFPTGKEELAVKAELTRQ